MAEQPLLRRRKVRARAAQVGAGGAARRPGPGLVIGADQARQRPDEAVGDLAVAGAVRAGRRAVRGQVALQIVAGGQRLGARGPVSVDQGHGRALGAQRRHLPAQEQRLLLAERDQPRLGCGGLCPAEQATADERKQNRGDRGQQQQQPQEDGHAWSPGGAARARRARRRPVPRAAIIPRTMGANRGAGPPDRPRHGDFRHRPSLLHWRSGMAYNQEAVAV